MNKCVFMFVKIYSMAVFLCFVDRTSLYNIVNEAKLVHHFS